MDEGVLDMKRTIVMAACVCIVCGSIAYAQTDASAASPAPKFEMSFWTTVRAAGWVGVIILLESMAAVALIIEHFIVIRREHFVADDLATAIQTSLEANKIGDASTLCEQSNAFLAKVVHAGLARVGSLMGFYDIQTAMQEAGERELSRLYRRLDYLSFIASTAPMLGLLGTVTGMIHSFTVIAATEGTARPSQLAGGISEALVTTCMGLIVAIPVMFFISLFRNRIDDYVAQAESKVDGLMARFRGVDGV
jgi:biopolymer transport protein ExbB